ncbi:MAG: hypothetical protein COZ18_11255 [Flexibacter sp. CG_4_10_14_3_um_filter_32_15]|nr:MAG: hypothetical protein COZ18_11255 [Flexibacter sp. CG_4_10_14_3_um_filter_32_15]
MKKFSPYISAFLVASMFYMLYQIKQVAGTMTKFADTLHHTTVLLLFSICGLLAIMLSLSGFNLSGFKSENFDDGLKYVSYFGCFGAIVIVLVVWLFPFFV